MPTHAVRNDSQLVMSIHDKPMLSVCLAMPTRYCSQLTVRYTQWYAHYPAHSFSLCVQEVTTKHELPHNSMELIFQRLKLIKFSLKRVNVCSYKIAFSEGESALFLLLLG